jgi:EmrB/QacA subfamily drug resistance transporter
VSHAEDRANWRAFAVCIGVAALTIVDLSGVNVALPSIQRTLHADATQLQLIVAGYTLAFGLALVPSGRLGDAFSRRRLFVIGLCGFVTASALCVVAPNDTWLTTTRILQGLAAGTQMPQVLGLVQQLFRGESRGTAFGVFGAMLGIATALGPTVGGLLLAAGGEALGWRLLFALNVPFGIVAIVLALKLLPRRQDADPTGRQLDPVGIVLLGATAFCLMLPFLLTTGGSGDDPLRWLWLIGAAAGGAALAIWEVGVARRGRSPIIHGELFRLLSYRDGLLFTALYFAGMPAGFLITTLFLQEGLHVAPLPAGLVIVPFALGSGVASYVGGRLVARFGRAMVVLGVGTVAVGITGVTLAAVFAPRSAVEWLMGAAMLIAGVGGGLVVSPNQTLTLADVPVEQGSIAGSMVQLGQRIGTAVGVSAVTGVFFSQAAGGHGVGAYRDAIGLGFLITLGLLAAAFVVGLIDLRARARSR